MKRGPTLPAGNGDEYEAFSRWRRVICWRRGELRRIKRAYRRRARRVLNSQDS